MLLMKVKVSVVSLKEKPQQIWSSYFQLAHMY